VLQHQSAFVDALRSGRQMRKRIFDTIEERHAHDLRNSSLGPAFYEELLSAVRQAGMAEAVKEFESRFLPILNSEETEHRATTAADQRRRSGVGAISALFIISLLGGLVIGFKALKITTAEATRSSATTTFEHMPVAAPAVADELKTTEPSSEVPTEAVPASSAEKEPSVDER
jgi:hypothetical protein